MWRHQPDSSKKNSEQNCKDTVEKQEDNSTSTFDENETNTEENRVEGQTYNNNISNILCVLLSRMRTTDMTK